ncbi:DinB superfamily protein [Mariniflexile rhizosphaerae]|uniref:DinB family protein n=1 Tax=unclassified Mariniflexile TaxID=2643887 RepID=UPI000CB6074A|nr:DinB family protein [Mariniflexile sp. TRM1-10]AXP82878.1 DinB superfamily protein [Mariniflexile sp. TRM1-10]PLB18211.1 MAG: DNA damage-inducible protein DinB [Flavobacteriaceae bacterium FS1-H7996/R]
MKISEVKPNEFSEFYANYLALVPKETTLIDGFNKDLKEVVDFFQHIPAIKLNYAYAKEKWRVKEVFQHLIDTERVFQYRCFCIARRDKTPLPGFEQDDYIAPSQAKNKSIESLVEEFKSVRLSFIALLNSLSNEDLQFLGNANGNTMSARAAAFIVLGHNQWHINIIKERYL